MRPLPQKVVVFFCQFKVAKMEGKSAGFLKTACNLKRRKIVRKTTKNGQKVPFSAKKRVKDARIRGVSSTRFFPTIL